MALRIEDYALIGDTHSAALVGRNGSIDWLCWPRFDSGACFAALLGTPEHGCWRIAPADPAASVTRRYRDGTLILETTFRTGDGEVVLTDCMPPRDGGPVLLRQISGRRGRVAMELDLALRFDYGRNVPWVTRLPEANGIRAISGPDMVVLHSPVPLKGEDLRTRARFEVAEGQTLVFELIYSPSHLPLPAATAAPETLLAHTEASWRGWSDRVQAAGPWTEAVRRSVITLKGLTYRPTGGIVAAPTAALPEEIGGVRNWDYRYCWLRDATLTLLALLQAGYTEDAVAWRDWLLRATKGSPSQIQIMYGIGGERRLMEWEANWLPGYEGSHPVRIGNAAHDQLQLDVFGELMDALHQGHLRGLPNSDDAWQLQKALLEHLATVWQEPDEGMWEVRDGRRCFTYSKVMAWAALDRAVHGIESFGLSGPLDRWRALRAEIHADVCRHGYDASIGSFVGSYGSRELDASLLLLPAVGFLPAEDPRILGTITAVERDLLQDGLVRRYRPEKAQDGLPGSEGVFLACSFWLADAYALTGRKDKARALFERLLDLRNDVGLLSEEYDPRARRMLGNFPQAFSHVGLVNTAYALARSGGQSKPVRSGTGDGSEPR
ncbi:glycoside hydrolase family 15 protein [Belnapia sp. T6]|uniref:Glycoside hydrolase family 15 protein n=1 Tax=Belnapia mucosa TaxID=2804532 RepID=A0ABS1V4J1_9PROT|nr:glycoside hydrolase family 15 protein [Belnapia mucosa]MBL6456602.1 glycoside hydrolase family 15 protein [Belnapia mucosa]